MIFCPKCGAQNQEGSSFCYKCGSAIQNSNTAMDGAEFNTYRPMPANIENHLVKAIISTLCCCLPLGIVSIVFAAQVDSKRNAGDIQGAIEASRKADQFANYSIIAGVVFTILYIIFIFMTGLSGYSGY